VGEFRAGLIHAAFEQAGFGQPVNHQDMPGVAFQNRQDIVQGIHFGMRRKTPYIDPIAPIFFAFHSQCFSPSLAAAELRWQRLHYAIPAQIPSKGREKLR